MAEMRLEGRGSIEAYISDAGLICLKQEDGVQEPQIVCMTEHDIPQVIEWLQELVGQLAYDDGE